MIMSHGVETLEEIGAKFDRMEKDMASACKVLDDLNQLGEIRVEILSLCGRLKKGVEDLDLAHESIDKQIQEHLSGILVSHHELENRFLSLAKQADDSLADIAKIQKDLTQYKVRVTALTHSRDKTVALLQDHRRILESQEERIRELEKQWEERDLKFQGLSREFAEALSRHGESIGVHAETLTKLKNRAEDHETRFGGGRALAFIAVILAGLSLVFSLVK